MAGKDAAKAPDAGEGAPSKPQKKLPTKMIAVALAVVLLEVGTVAVTVTMAGGPKRVIAEAPAATQKEQVEKDAEVKIIDAKLPNSKRGRLFLYDLQVVAKVGEKEKGKVAELLAEREAEVKDRIRTILASSDPVALEEPGLETLRRQIKYQLEHDLGKDLIKDLLIPKCTPFRAEF